MKIPGTKKHIRRGTIADNPKRKKPSLSEKYDKDRTREAKRYDKEVYK
jgi:hypothetical protein